ncbi:MAG: hypothetical protein JSW59_10330 [Phycisphaerales bacterium]|nr:MAG: hypothetical protein JSW59_10330 [Phycisphaerales bacterium]
MNRRSGKINANMLVVVFVAGAVVIGIVAVVKLDVVGEKGSGLSKEFKYDVAELTYIDPNLILYEESAEAIDTGFTSARTIAVDAKSTIYVGGDKSIRVFASSGKLLDEIGLDQTPGCLTVSADGSVFVGLRDHVEIYDMQGRPIASWKSLGSDAILTSVVVSEDDVFVADAGNRVVVRYDRRGNIVARIGEKDPERNVPGFVVPSAYFDLALSGDGLLRAVNPGRLRVDAYTFDGDYEFSWGKGTVDVDGFCGCCNPVNIAVLPGGGFVTCEKGLVRVKIYDSQGEFKGVVAGPVQLVRDGDVRVCDLPEECQAGGFDIAVDDAGRVYVLDTIKNVVRLFTRMKGQ